MPKGDMPIGHLSLIEIVAPGPCNTYTYAIVGPAGTLEVDAALSAEYMLSAFREPLFPDTVSCIVIGISNGTYPCQQFLRLSLSLS